MSILTVNITAAANRHLVLSLSRDKVTNRCGFTRGTPCTQSPPAFARAREADLLPAARLTLLSGTNIEHENNVSE